MGKDSTYRLSADHVSILWIDISKYGRVVDSSNWEDRDSLAVLTAGATKEIAYLKKFGRALQPFQRLRREVYNYQAQSHLEHIMNLEKYLKVAPHLVSRDCPALHRPVLRHPDLQPNNIFVSNKLEIKGLIDWQHSTVLPLFLQCGIPQSLQNYGDEISESL